MRADGSDKLKARKDSHNSPEGIGKDPSSPPPGSGAGVLPVGTAIAPPSISPETTSGQGGDQGQVILVGNPNVGKSVVFGVLTGNYAVVSNYPGTTVEVTRGRISLDGHSLRLVDTPGVNSLLPMSEDEVVTRDILMGVDRSDSILMVLDSKSLRRGLSLVAQVAEMGLPMAVDLNMCDEARDRGLRIDVGELGAILGIPLVETVATRRQGTADIVETIGRACSPVARVDYGPRIEKAVARIVSLLPATTVGARAVALMLVCKDASLKEWVGENLSVQQRRELDNIIRDCEEIGEQPQLAIRRARIGWVDSVLDRVLTRQGPPGRQLEQKLGDLAMSPVAGIPIMLGAMALTFLFVGVLGAGYAVDFMQEVVFQEYLVPWFSRLLRVVVGVGAVGNFLLGSPDTPVGEGAGLLVGDHGLMSMGISYAVGIVLPIVTSFFIVFALMEDSGYLPRLAVMANRVFKFMGLNGKAILPMVLGLGCATMATVTARIMPTRKERIIVTLLLALAVPCAAQLGVIMAMLAGLGWRGILVWAVCVFGLMVLVGWLASRVVRGDESEFVLEVPPLRRPMAANVLLKTRSRVVWFLKEAVPIFMIGTLILWALSNFGLLDAVRAGASPLVQGILGLPAQATDALVIGFLRRDYGAAGLFELSRSGMLDSAQLLTSLVTITLFIPCIAHLLMIIKERGMLVAMAIVVVVLPLSFAMGGLVNLFVTLTGWL